MNNVSTFDQDWQHVKTLHRRTRWACLILTAATLALLIWLALTH